MSEGYGDDPVNPQEQLKQRNKQKVAELARLSNGKLQPDKVEHYLNDIPRKVKEVWVEDLDVIDAGIRDNIFDQRTQRDSFNANTTLHDPTVDSMDTLESDISRIRAAFVYYLYVVRSNIPDDMTSWLDDFKRRVKKQITTEILTHNPDQGLPTELLSYREIAHHTLDKSTQAWEGFRKQRNEVVINNLADELSKRGSADEPSAKEELFDTLVDQYAKTTDDPDATFGAEIASAMVGALDRIGVDRYIHLMLGLKDNQLPDLAA